MNLRKIITVLGIGAIALGLSACGDSVGTDGGDVDISFNGVDEYQDQLFSYFVELDTNIATVEAELTDADGKLVDGYFYIGANAAGEGTDENPVNALDNPASQDIDVDQLFDSDGEPLDPMNFEASGSFNGITCDGEYTLKITLVDIEGNEKVGTKTLSVSDLGACETGESSSSAGEIVVGALLTDVASYELGDNSNATLGSYIDLNAGETYLMSQRTEANVLKIDFQYAVGADGTGIPTGSIFITPDYAKDYTTNLIWSGAGFSDVNELSVIYSSTMTAAEFDAATKVESFLGAYDPDAAEGYLTVSEGDVIVVETEAFDPDADGFVGMYLVKITDLDSGAGGSISFEVKTEAAE